MKRVKILVCGFSLAIALVALPFPYIDDITSGLGFSIAAVLLAWFGILERRGAKDGYKRDVRLYSASTMMKVVHVEESEYDRRHCFPVHGMGHGKTDDLDGKYDKGCCSA